jgi:hypothetical protein
MDKTEWVERFYHGEEGDDGHPGAWTEIIFETPAAINNDSADHSQSST